MTDIPFEKWHGLGNDFVVVRQDDLGSGDWSDAFVAWCDRHRGIGADGVLVISNETADGFHLEVTNRDGSIPEICGNGTRCAVRSWAARHGVRDGRAEVLTGAGLKRCGLDRSGRVSVDLGPAALVGEGLPKQGEDKLPMRLPVRLGERDYIGLAVSMGNPHLVIFAPSWGEVPRSEASRLEHLSDFPNRVNVSFATEPSGDRIELRVWERGVGFTQACGSAACATAVAAAVTGRLPFGPNASVVIGLPGGDLDIEVTRDLQSVLMTGSATFVFRGRIESPIF